MSEATYHPLEAILRMCAQAAPAPWHHRVYARQSGVDLAQLDGLLELLWLEGLIEKAAGTPETGPGITLTPKGQQVLSDPEALERLRQGQALTPDDAGGAIRESLRQTVRPVVTRALVLANLLVFAYGAWLASRQPGGAGPYLSGTGGLAVLDQLGMLWPKDVVEGKWWRLLTTTFLHGGVLHIAMNMYTLYMVGGFVEQTWGRWRFLLIYLLSAWGGSCLAMAYTGGHPVVGASGAICGVMATEGVWVLLYGRHLPKSMARRGRSQLMTTLILMVVISLIPRVSGWAHLGGALAGAAAAVALHFQRFGPGVLRVIGVLALLPLPWASYAFIEYTWKNRPPIPGLRKPEKDEPKEKRPARGRKPGKKAEDDPGWAAGPFFRHHADPVYEAAEALERICLKMPIAAAEIKKDGKAARQAVDDIARQQKTLADQQAELKKAQYEDKGIEKARLEALDLIEAALTLCDLASGNLKEPMDANKAELQAGVDKLVDRMERFREQMKTLRAR